MKLGSTTRNYYEISLNMISMCHKKFQFSMMESTCALANFQILKGPLKKDLATNNALIEEFAKHSREYHKLREDITRGKSNGDGGQDRIDSIIAKLEAIGNRITKMGESIHAIQVGCEACNRPHLTRDCELDENRYKKAQLCYLSEDTFDEDWRKPRWKPYEYKKEKEDKYQQQNYGF